MYIYLDMQRISNKRTYLLSIYVICTCNNRAAFLFVMHGPSAGDAPVLQGIGITVSEE